MRITSGLTSLDVICGALACLLVFHLITRSRKIPKGLRLPPGPPSKPIIGNVTDLPKGPPWLTFDRWAKAYGPLVHLNILGQSVVIVNSLEVAHDLLDERSSIYSDRLEFPMVVDLMKMGWNMATMRYGDWWRRHRKMFHQYFCPNAVVAYEDIQVKETRVFLQNLHGSPDDFMEHIRNLAGAIILKTVYGIKVLPKGDPYIELAEAGMAAASEAGLLGKFLVDVFPFLKYVPEWVPGAGFKRKARK